MRNYRFDLLNEYQVRHIVVPNLGPNSCLEVQFELSCNISCRPVVPTEAGEFLPSERVNTVQGSGSD